MSFELVVVSLLKLLVSGTGPKIHSTPGTTDLEGLLLLPGDGGGKNDSSDDKKDVWGCCYTPSYDNCCIELLRLFCIV